jgi:hypothetical protein
MTLALLLRLDDGILEANCRSIIIECGGPIEKMSRSFCR